METISDVKNAIQSLKKMRTSATRAAARGLAWQHLLLPPALPSIRSLLSFLLDLDVVAPSLSLSAKSPPSSLSRTTTESTLALSGTAAALASFLSPSVAIIEAVVREFSKWVKVGEQGEGEGEGEGEGVGEAGEGGAVAELGVEVVLLACAIGMRRHVESERSAKASKGKKRAREARTDDETLPAGQADATLTHCLASLLVAVRGPAAVAHILSLVTEQSRADQAAQEQQELSAMLDDLPDDISLTSDEEDEMHGEDEDEKADEQDVDILQLLEPTWRARLLSLYTPLLPRALALALPQLADSSQIVAVRTVKSPLAYRSLVQAQVSERVRLWLLTNAVRRVFPLFADPGVLWGFCEAALAEAEREVRAHGRVPDNVLRLTRAAVAPSLWLSQRSSSASLPHVYDTLYFLLDHGATLTLGPAAERASFLESASTLISSPGLTTATACALAKRLARLALRLSPVGAHRALVLLCLLYSKHTVKIAPLLSRVGSHDTSKVFATDHAILLLGSPGAKATSGGAAGGAAGGEVEDTFDGSAASAEEAGAAGSSLWESQLLGRHFLPALSSSLLFLHSSPPPPLFFDAQKLASTTWYSMAAELLQKDRRTIVRPPTDTDHPIQGFN